MTLRYFWENVIVNVEQDTGDVAPHTRQVRKDIDYEYEVVVKDRDVIDYLIPYDLSTKNKKKTDKEIEEVRCSNLTPRQWAVYRLIYTNSLVLHRKTTQRQESSLRVITHLTSRKENKNE